MPIFNSPGPCSYDAKAENNLSSKLLQKTPTYENGSKKIGFGSQAARKTDQSLILQEQIPVLKKNTEMTNSAIYIETYEK